MSQTVRQATCVAVEGRGLLIEGPPGSGKSSLALGLIDRGATLVGDDGVLLAAEDDRLIARPHPATRGLIEVRGVGLVTFEVTDSVPLALVIRFEPQAPRFVERARTVAIAGVDLPLIEFDPAGSLLPLRAEFALRDHGLCRS
jgi:serine kinase of HPr protein (carbohydrate metabolism regulator)